MPNSLIARADNHSKTIHFPAAPTLLNFFLPFALFTVLICFAPPAFAGHYGDPVYSGVTSTEVLPEDGGSIDQDFHAMNDGSWGVKADNGGATIAIDGPVKATFTWIPDYVGEPLPESVIVTEAAAASWFSLDYGDDPAGSADDGLSDSEVTYSLGGTSSGTHYEVKEGQTTITVTANPSVTVTCSGGDNYAEASVSASVSPVTIGFGGTLKNGMHQDTAMVGQDVSIALNGTVGAVEDVEWTVSGGMPFSAWFADQTSTIFEGFDAIDYYDTLINSVYFEKQDLVAVSASADLVFPDGSSGSVSAQKVLATVAPTIVSVDKSAGTVHWDENADKSGVMHAITNNSALVSNAAEWYLALQTPEPFASQQGDGSWNFVQTITQGRWRKAPGSSSETGVGPQNTMYGLDTTYPYQPTNAGCDSDYAPGYPADNNSYNNGDSPSQPIQNSYVEYRVSEPFKTWAMFRPPGVASEWVPVYKWEWNWGGLLERDNLAADWNFASVGVAFTSDAVTTDFPSWSACIVAP